MIADTFPFGRVFFCKSMSNPKVDIARYVCPTQVDIVRKVCQVGWTYFFYLHLLNTRCNFAPEISNIGPQLSTAPGQ